MRVFVYEYVCGGGMAGRPLPESLAREGWAMLASIADDLARIERVRVSTMLDARLRHQPLGVERRLIADAGSEPELFKTMAREADATLVIAPEFDGVLAQRVRWVEGVQGQLLGSGSPAVALAADKLACSRLFECAGVATPATRLVDRSGDCPGLDGYPAVLKPRYGAGSQGVVILRGAAEWTAALRTSRSECGGDSVLQPFLPGLAASVSILVGDGFVIPLLPAEQRLSGDGRLRYRGGRMPLGGDLAARAIELGCRAVRAIPGLRGYVGVDLVLAAQRATEARRGTAGRDAAHVVSGAETSPAPLGDAVIELNPRLTTSYVGLRALCRGNLADCVLRAARGEELAPLAWRPGTVCFEPDGTLAWQPDPRRGTGAAAGARDPIDPS